MKTIKIGSTDHQVSEEVYELFEQMAKEIEASRSLIGAAGAAMAPLMGILPAIINPESEQVNALELMTQMGKLKKDDSMKKNFAALQAAQLAYAQVTQGK